MSIGSAGRWSPDRRSGSLCGTLFIIALVGGLLPATGAAEARAPRSAMVLDDNSGKILYSQNIDAPRYPASLTKIMTLYIVFEMIQQGRLAPNTKLVVTSHAASQPPSKLGLKPATTMVLRDAIRALVTKSANDVAVAVAENLAGTEEKFARIMTWKARQIGMSRTTFRNASGLPDPRQITTARDMITLARRMIEDFPKEYRVFRTRYFRYHHRRYRNHNGLLFNFAGTDGIKTGYTRAAGFNLVASVRRGRKHVLGVVMGGSSAGERNRRMRKLLRKALKRASMVRLARPPHPPRQPARPRRIARAHTLPAAPVRPPMPMLVSARPMPVSARRGSESAGSGSGSGSVGSGANDVLPWRRAASRHVARRAQAAPRPMLARPRQAVLRAPAPHPASRPARRPRLALGTMPPAPSPSPAPARSPIPSPTRSPIPSPTRAPRLVTALRGSTGPFHVQIGAFLTERDANLRLAEVRGKAGALLSDHPPMTMTFQARADRVYYRARFAGFDKAKAKTTCQHLKQRHISCIVMHAN